MKKMYYISAGVCAILSITLVMLYVLKMLPQHSSEDAVFAAISEAAGEQLPPNFETLSTINDDIYAWLDIPDSQISTPVLQCVEDQDFYLDHGLDRNKSPNGALFTEPSYNTADFSDILTVVYGHRAESGTMFGGLQTLYSDPEQYVACKEIVIYQPQKELHYKVFAAVPYDNRHLLYQYDFSNPKIYSAFFSSVENIRTLGTQLSPSDFPEYPTPVLILSTCLEGDEKSRYLVMAKLVE